MEKKRSWPPDFLKKYPGLEEFAAIPYLTLVRFKQWDKLINSPKPSNKHKYILYMYRYGKGIAHAQKKELKLAKKELAKLQKLKRHKYFDGRVGFPFEKVIQIAALELEGAIAYAEGDKRLQIKCLQEAISIQDDLTYSEPPSYYYPVRQGLGQAYLDHQQYNKAESTFKADLALFPDNGWSLYGLYESLKNQGKEKEAEQAKAAWKAAWANADFNLTE